MILAADPGLTGAFAVVAYGHVHVKDMPTYTAPAGPRQRDRDFLDFPKIIETLAYFQVLGCEILVIEKVGGIPGQAAHAAFGFGEGAGFIRGAAMVMGYRVELVPPSTWKSAMRCPSDKKKAIGRATELMPAWANLWAPTRGNGSEAQRSGRAEAALMSLYGETVFGALK